MREHDKNMRHRAASKKSRKVFCHDNSNAHRGQKDEVRMKSKGVSSPKSLGDIGNAALHYAGLGLSVIPLEPEAKRPAVVTGNGVYAATTDADQIRRWWTANPLFNVGVACGASGLVVIDVDGHRGEKSLAALERRLGDLPETVEQITPGKILDGQHTGKGRHLIFKDEQHHLSSMEAIGAGIDVRAIDGQIVVAPSRHPDGTGTYEFVPGRSFDDITPATLPEAWVEFLQEICSEKRDAAYESHGTVASASTSHSIGNPTINIEIHSIGVLNFRG